MTSYHTSDTLPTVCDTLCCHARVKLSLPCQQGTTAQFYHYYRTRNLTGTALSRGMIPNTNVCEKELLLALSDAAEAHEQADERAKILHRDISPGNILIMDNGGGLLIDWDLAKDRNETVPMAQGESQPERTGTYQFMAARFVNEVSHLDSESHNRLDDIESMFHVLQWIILRYIDLGLHGARLEIYLKEYFDFALPMPGGVPVCPGRLKRVEHDFKWRDVRNHHPVLKQLVKGIRKIIVSRYIDPDDLQQMPVQLRLRNELDTKEWLVTSLRDAANDPACPTTDASVPQIIFKGTKSEINRVLLLEKSSLKVRKGNDGQRNPPRAAKTKANSNLTEADIDNFTVSVNDSLAMVDDDDPSESNDEGPSKRRKSTNRMRGH